MSGTKIYEYLKDLFILRYVSKDKLKDNHIYWNYKDKLAIVVVARGEDPIESLEEVIVTKELLGEFGISKNELYYDAYNNVAKKFPSDPPTD